MSIYLDFRTLSLTTVLFSVIFGVGMLVYSRLHKSFTGIDIIGLGHLLIGSGYVLLGLRGVINDFVSVVIANSAIYIGVIVIYRGLFRFLGISFNLERYLSPLLAASLAVLLYYYKFHVPNVNIRIIFFSLFFSAICFIAIFGLLKYEKEFGRTAVKLIISMFFIIGVFHLFRVLWTIYEAQLHDFMQAGFIHSLTIIGSEFVVLLTSFATIWITTDVLQSKLTKMAQTDPLTQLYNRRAFKEYCDVEFSRTLRTNEAFSIIMCDLDHFKSINDQHGHQIGDEVLKVFADVLRNNVRKHDVVARFGGEEFVILLPETDIKNGLVVAEHLRTAVQSASAPTNAGSNLTFSASFGVSQYSDGVNEWAVVLDHADKALYSAKEQGRNRVISS